jgi:hypothetical protein
MCPTRIESKLEPIELDLSAAFSLERGFGRAELLQFGAELEHARRTFLDAADGDMQRCVAQPQRLLAEYHLQRKNSLLGEILSHAKQLRETVDQVVMLGPPQLTAAAQALFAACGHPYHNELTRGQRGGRPRIYFLTAAPENDAIQALLEVLPHRRLLHTVDERWGLLAIADDGYKSCEDNTDQRLLTGLFSFLWDRLQTTATASNEAERSAVVGRKHSPLTVLAEEIGLPRIDVNEMSPSTHSPSAAFFHAGVLLAASVMGIDIVKLLRGAVGVSERFEAAPPGDNPPLDVAGLCQLLIQRMEIHGLRVASSVSALACMARNLQQPRSDNDLLIQWIPGTVRHDRLSVALSTNMDSGDRKKKKDFLLSEIANQQAQAIRDARFLAGQYTVVVKLADVDEGSVGQLIQLHLLADAMKDGLSCDDSPLRKAGG